jgi:serine/threonine protein kinase
MPKLVIAGIEKDVEQECILGRHRSSGLQVASEAASRQHAKVALQDGQWWVEDLGSANGTSLNGSRLSERKRLRDGDLIAIGQVEITFRVDPTPVAKRETDVPEPPAAPAAPPGADITALAGQQIAGYRIERFLGRGLHGAVYRAQQLNLDRPVAFKVFDPARCIRDAGLRQRFLAEAGKVGSVTHDGLVQLHESGEHEGLLWCSMEWVDGDTLEKLLARDTRLEPQTAFVIAEKIAEALAAAHARGVIHGDLRPAHVIVMADGRVKLTDVGMLGIFEEAELPASAPAKDAWYLAPEEVGEGASDPRSDIYSLGCLLYHLLVGRPPFAGADFKAVVQAHAREAIPSLAGTGIRGDVRQVDAMILGLLAKQPGLRPATMTEVISELQAVRRQAPATNLSPVRSAPRVPISAEQPRPTRTAPSIQQRVKAYLMPAGVVLGLVVVGILIIPRLTSRVVPTSAVEPAADVSPAEPAPAVAPEPAAPPVPAASVPAAKPSPVPSPSAALAESWRGVQAVVDRAQAKPDWPAAEQALATFATTAVANPELAQAVRDRQRQLSADGDRWYRTQLAALPTADGVVVLADRLRQLNLLRDAVLADNRADAQSRYQEALTKLGQSLDAARRQARQLIEAGKVDQLPALTTGLAPAFAGTSLVDAQRQFAILCTEAAAAKPQWQGTWALTHPRLLAAKGEPALAAAAVLLLVGESTEAKALLANDPALASGVLLRRREALTGRPAAILSFDQADDLRYIEVITGEPRMTAGMLTAAAGEPITMTCVTPIRSSGWEVVVGANLEATQGDAQAQFSLGVGDVADAQIRIEGQAVTIKIRTATGWEDAQVARPVGKAVRLRLAERAGSVLVSLNEQKILTAAAAKIAPGAVFRFAGVGLAWGLTTLQVVAGD